MGSRKGINVREAEGIGGAGLNLGWETESLVGEETSLVEKGEGLGGVDVTCAEGVTWGGGEMTLGVWGLTPAGILAVPVVGLAAFFGDLFLAAPVFNGAADFRLDLAGVLTFFAPAGTGLEADFGGLSLVPELGAAGFFISACGLRVLG
ncbi:MAG: hypothetical protein WBB73_00060 [Candidatus Aminicenantaceae bacterium]